MANGSDVHPSASDRGVDPTGGRDDDGQNGIMPHSTLYSPSFKGHLARRFAHLGVAFGLLALAVVGLVFLVLTLVSVPLVLVSVGIPLTIAVVWLSRGITRAQRAVFRRLFGKRIDNPYRPWPRGHIGLKLLALTKDVTVWRDIAWHAINSTLGFLVYLTAIVLFAASLFYLVYPILWLAWPSVFNTYFGLHIDNFATAMWGLPIAAIAFSLWWWLGDMMLDSYASLATLLLRPTRSVMLKQRVEQLTESRAESVDSSAAELRRIERDLHDGAQARLVALGMSLGMAEGLLESDPVAAGRLLAEARENSGTALVELRNLVRGIHPPVLSDRGLTGAVEALALDHPLPVTVLADLPGRPPAPVESAAYFAIAEVLTNTAKYAKASQVRVMIGYFGYPPREPAVDDDESQLGPRLGIVIRDDGVGGAIATEGGGLAGVVRRLSAFDGVVAIDSPVGGPTVITLEIPCLLSPDPSGRPAASGTV